MPTAGVAEPTATEAAPSTLTWALRLARSTSMSQWQQLAAPTASRTLMTLALPTTPPPSILTPDRRLRLRQRPPSRKATEDSIIAVAEAAGTETEFVARVAITTPETGDAITSSTSRPQLPTSG